MREALAERYAIERELGAGGMATVYLAEAAEAIAFLTLDERQAAAARALGFRP